jgi:hypothetical protein
MALERKQKQETPKQAESNSDQRKKESKITVYEQGCQKFEVFAGYGKTKARAERSRPRGAGRGRYSP